MDVYISQVSIRNFTEQQKQVNIQNDVIALVKVQSHTQNLGIKLFITTLELKYIQSSYLRPTQNMSYKIQ